MIKMDMKIDLGKIKDLKAMLKKYPTELEDALEQGILNIALTMEGIAKQKVKEHGAVDLGQLLNSITVKRISKKHVIVGTNLEYAAAIEFGTKGHWIRIENIPGFRNWMRSHGIDLDEKMKYFFVAPKPRPYMEPAFQKGKQILPDEVKAQIESTIIRLNRDL